MSWLLDTNILSVSGDGRKTGHTVSQPDLLIAATAAYHGLTVVSRDTIHYVRAGIQVFNPWTG